MTPIFCENMKEKVKLDWEGESLNQSSELIDHSCPTLGLSFLTTPPPQGSVREDWKKSQKPNLLRIPGSGID